MSLDPGTADSRSMMDNNLRSRRPSAILAVIGIVLFVAVVWRFFDRAQWWWLWGL